MERKREQTFAKGKIHGFPALGKRRKISKTKTIIVPVYFSLRRKTNKKTLRRKNEKSSNLR